MNKTILASEPMSLVTQTEHEKVMEKVLDDHQQQAAIRATNRLIELKRSFAYDFINMSEIVMGLSAHKRDNFREAVNNFCERFSPEERIALEGAVRQHPKYKMHFAFFVTLLVSFISSFAMLESGGGPVMCVSLSLMALHTVLSSIGNTAIVQTHFLLDPFFHPVVRYFFLRRRLIHLGGPKAPEEAIEEMRWW